MASKVLVKMPAVNFSSTSQTQQLVPKKGAELVALGRADSSGAALVLPSMSADPLLRITQLEQNIRFLHEQHQLMLTSLHQEIDTLRQRNRDLQFQLVFTKKNAAFGGQQTSSESSPDDDGKSKIFATSPNQLCNTQNLQVEILEKDISDLRTALNELTEKNNNLTRTLDDQEKQLEKALGIESEYETRLEDANKLIKRLRKENDDQSREMNILRSQLNGKTSMPSASLPSSSSGGGRQASGGPRRGGSGSDGGRNDKGERDRDDLNGSGGGGGGRDNNVHRRENSSGQQQHGHHRFPPLHSQQYWQRSRQQNNESCSGSSNFGNGGENSQTLPHLQQRHHYNNQQNKGNHHNNGSGRYYNGNHGGGHHHYYSNNHRVNRGGSSGGGGGGGGGGNRGGSGNQRHHQQQQHQQEESH